MGGGGGSPLSGSGPEKTKPALSGTSEADARQPFTRERGLALGLSPRAIAALADSASGNRGRASVGRATTLMSGPGSGTALVTVPSGTPLSLNGCQAVGGATWCQASHAGFSGWVAQADIGR